MAEPTDDQQEEELHPDLQQIVPHMETAFHQLEKMIEAQGDRLSLVLAAFVNPDEEGEYVPQAHVFGHGDDWQVTTMLLGLIFRACYKAGTMDKLLAALDYTVDYYRQAEQNKKERGH